MRLVLNGHYIDLRIVLKFISMRKYLKRLCEQQQ